MDRLKATFTILAIIGVALIMATFYCYIKVVVYAPKPPPTRVDNIFVDLWEAWIEYDEAMRALRPYRWFFENAWIFLSIIIVLLIALSATRLTAEKH